MTLSHRQRLGIRLLSRRVLVEPESAGRVRVLAARLLRGDAVADSEFEGVLGVSPFTANADGTHYTRRGHIGIIAIDGVISFAPDLFDLFMGCNPTGTIVEALNQAADDDQVRAVVLDVHCPGGSVYGWSDLAAALDRLVAKKPVHTICHDLCASLAYRMAVRGTSIVATATALIGSIGSMIGPIYDFSEFLAKEGIKIFPIANPEEKLVGAPGYPLTAENTKPMRRIVDSDSDEFFAEVSERRDIPKDDVANLKAGLFKAADAMAMGLVDEVVGYDEFMARLEAEQASPAGARPGGVKAAMRGVVSTKESDMDWKDITPETLKANRPDVIATIEQTAEQRGREAASAEAKKAADEAAQKPATLEQIEAAIPEGTPGREKLILDSLKAKHTAAQASAAAVKAALDENARLSKQVGALKALNGAGGGVEPTEFAPKGGSATPGNPSAEKHPYVALVEKVAQENNPKTGKPFGMHAAWGEAARREPKQHADWLAKKRSGEIE